MIVISILPIQSPQWIILAVRCIPVHTHQSDRRIAVMAAVWNITAALGGVPRFGRTNFALDPGLTVRMNDVVSVGSAEATRSR
jgi:hypothetical protein